MDFATDTPTWAWVAATLVGLAVYVWRNFSGRLWTAAAPAPVSPEQRTVDIGQLTIRSESSEPVRLQIPLVIHISSERTT